MPTIDDTKSATNGRRREDARPGAERALQWAERPTDLLLLPHSPLALADVLSHAQGCFDLIGEGAPPPAGSTGDTVRPIRSGRTTVRLARARSNLLTRHDTDTLRERCRAAMVEAALVRTRNERRLYFAAGFLRADGLNAPVLLYPALLVCKHDGDGHELRIEDTVPDRNQRVLAHCLEHFDTRLPAHDGQEALADYFARLAAAVAPVDGLDFAFEVAIGNAEPGFLSPRLNTSTLPDVPARFDASLAMALASDVSLEELDAVLHLLPDLLAANGEVRRVPMDGQEPLGRLKDCSVKLAARGLDHVPFDQLGQLPERIDRWCVAIRRARQSETVATLFAEHRFKVRQLARLGSIIELVDKAPAATENARHADLAFESTAQLLRRASHQSHLIEEEFAALQEYFLLEKLPGKCDLLQLMDDLERLHGVGEKGAGIVDADYFHARRQFMEFSVEKPVHLDDTHRRRLAQLIKVLRFRELFVNNTEYRRALGSNYRGLRTDWAGLGTLVDYARELAEVLGSEALAGKVMADFAQFRVSLVEDLDALRAGTDALRDVVAALGRHWQYKPVDETLDWMEDTARKLRYWKERFGDMSEHRDLTAAAVLSRFTGQTRQDAETERRLQEARARIDLSLRSGNTDAAIVAETLQWLRAASVRAAERRLDIGAIVEHLQIA